MWYAGRRTGTSYTGPLRDHTTGAGVWVCLCVTEREGDREIALCMFVCVFVLVGCVCLCVYGLCVFLCGL